MSMSFYENPHDLSRDTSKKVGQIKNKFGEILTEKYIDRQLPVLKREFDRGGFPAVAAEQLHALNVRADYKLSGKPEFEDMRRRLNTEPGLIIANHPYAPIDAPIILDALQRKDVQIVVVKHMQPRLAATFGGQYFLPAGKETFKEIQEHIAKGGATLIFPGGTGDAERNMGFRKGFGEIIKGVPPDSMVYSFYIDIDQKEISKRLPGAGSDAFSGGMINLNNFKHPLLASVHERYTQARQWQDVANKAGNRKWLQSDFNEYFKSLFKD